MDTENWNIDRPTPYPRNARKLSPQAIDKVAASLQEFGWRQPIVVDSKGVVICGHTRLLAARSLGAATVPVHVAAELTPAQVKAYRLMDNRSHEETSWETALLGGELFDLTGLDFDLGLTGFNLGEIDGYLAALDVTAGLTDEDAVPEIPERPVTVAGDLWLLGQAQHKLLVGDATDPAAVARLMAGDSGPDFH